MKDRHRLAAAGHHLLLPPTTQQLVTQTDVQDALDTPLTVTLLSGPAAASAKRTSVGRIKPTRGNSFLVLSTGQADNEAVMAEPGTDHAPAGTQSGDSITLRIQLSPPPGATRLSFDYTFLSAEYPEWVGLGFNDSFTAKVTDSSGTRTVATASVDSSTFHAASDSRIGSSSYLLYVDNPSGVDTVYNTGLQPDAGTTDYQRVDVSIAAGNVTVEFEIHDVGDGIVDSAAIIDNLSVSSLEIVDPNVVGTRNTLVDGNGRVLFPNPGIPSELATNGRYIHSVAADGVTQVLLRGEVPGPGTVTFSIPSLQARDGAVSANAATLNWTSEVTVNAEFVNDKYYAFALYRAPADFDDPAPQHLGKERQAELSMSYAPPPPGIGFGPQPFTIRIIRPPLVIVPDIWSDCASLVSTSISDAHFPYNVTCVDYREQTGDGKKDDSFKGFDFNKNIVSDHIAEALADLRQTGNAVTQADVIGYGVGALFARKHIDSPDNYLRPDNFNEGDINRLISVDTPHLGSRLVDEIVETRDYLKTNKPAEWTTMIAALENVNIFINNDVDTNSPYKGLDEIATTSAQIASLGAPNHKVPYHAIYGTGARGFSRPGSQGHLDNAKALVIPMYDALETYHQSNEALADPLERQKLIFGSQSRIFCNPGDEHDLLATTAEQQGGLAAAFTTQSPVKEALSTSSEADKTSGHYRLIENATDSNSLHDLLNAPVGGAKFATSMTFPGIPTNGCALAGITPLAPGSFFTHTMHTPAQSSLVGTVAFSAPASGTTVVSSSTGADVLVQLQTSGPTPERVLVVGAGNALVFNAPPYKGSFHVPAEAIGAATLKAMAFYPGGIVISAPLALNVQVNASLTSIQTISGDVFLKRPGKTRQLTVIGVYSDNVRRDITSPALGTQYAVSLAPNGHLPVASISAGGLVTATAPGNASIVIRNGITYNSVNINVGEALCGNAVVDPGEQCDDGNAAGGDGCNSLCLRENKTPNAVCVAPANVCTDAGVCSANVTNLGAGSTDPDGDALSITQSPAGPYGVGHHAISVSVSDGEDAAQCVTQLDVLDCEQPSLTCPASFTAECTGAGSAAVTPPAAVATDNCSASVAAPAGGQLSLGSHALTYTASDPSGNSASCTTTVTVQDTTPPSITCPPPAVAECTGNNEAAVQIGLPTASDLCTAFTLTKPTDGPYPLGTTPLTFTAKDLAGNQASCTTSVKVVDTTPPQLSVTSPPPLWPIDHQYRTISLADCHPVVTDSCGGVLAPSTYQAAITCVTADEPDDTPGDHDGFTVNDIVIVDNTTVKLRAERHSSFDGRMYKIHFKVRDGSGNTTNGVCPVRVPYNECKPGDQVCGVVDSGVANSVCH